MIGICLLTLAVMGTAYALGETGAYWWPRLVVTVGPLGLLSWDRLATLVWGRTRG
ncbi:MAG: hypothetical protein J07HB67_02084 [halophilic archaeon J07HB67]|jgi:hypothetical protein|nr:MAG: hypothetical protein J07HB67_02084 [halophilic archaeon J07HB67]